MSASRTEEDLPIVKVDCKCPLCGRRYVLKMEYTGIAKTLFKYCDVCRPIVGRIDPHMAGFGSRMAKMPNRGAE